MSFLDLMEANMMADDVYECACKNETTNPRECGACDVILCSECAIACTNCMEPFCQDCVTPAPDGCGPMCGVCHALLVVDLAAAEVAA